MLFRSSVISYQLSVISYRLSVISEELTQSEWNEKYSKLLHFGETISTDLANYDGNYVYGRIELMYYVAALGTALPGLRSSLLFCPLFFLSFLPSGGSIFLMIILSLSGL